MRIELICTGEEVLSGQIVDTNAAWVADFLSDLGLGLQRKTTVGDRLEDLVALFKERSSEADVVIVNGGLGPTTDDLSAQAIATAMQEPLVLFDAWATQMRAFFKARQRVMPECNLKQAQLPQSAQIIDNPNGTACGFVVKLNQAYFFFTPGVPSEMKPMLTQQFAPWLAQHFQTQAPPLRQSYGLLGIGESQVQTQLKALNLEAQVAVGYRASWPFLELKLMAAPEFEAQLRVAIEQVEAEFQDALVSENRQSLAETVHHLLIQQGVTLAVAESCTGGLLASSLIDMAGSSAYFREGVVAYHGQTKVDTLGVSAEVLETQGEVSMPTALHMATGVRMRQDVDFALATTGIAGPSGGSPEKPVGTVCIALATRDTHYIQQVNLNGRSRTAIRQMTVAIALDMLRRALLKQQPMPDYPMITQEDKAQFQATRLG
jgi:nicotinamide-nucleotide amidase